MNTRILLPCLLGLLFAMPSVADGIYKWTDEDGVTHYSDVPRDGAEEMDIQPVQTYTSPAVTQSSSSSGSNDDVDDDADEQQGYQSIAVTSPSMEETIWNTGGNVQVSVTLRPGLQTGHELRLYLNGKSLGGFPPRSSSVTLTEIPRGTHIVQAEVLNEDGRVMIKSAPITFFYKQTAANTITRPRPTTLPTRRAVR